MINTFGGHTLHSIATGAGTLDALAWGAIQTGRWGTQQQLAYAFDVEGGFQPRILPQVKPWVRGGYTKGSGDGNASDKMHETFFQVLPTPRPYARFPFFNMMNTEDAFGSLMLRPHPKVTISELSFILCGSAAERSVVQRWRRVSTVDLRLHGARRPRAGDRWAICTTPASNTVCRARSC